MSGELIKLRIKAYSDEQFSEEVADGEFQTLLNPESYKFNYKIEQNDEQAPGTSAAAPRFNKAPPEDLKLEFVFDRTGVVADYSKSGGGGNFSDDGNGIIDDIDHFKE